MALSRSMLKAMSIEDEKIDQIIDAHTETVDALKTQRDEAKDIASKVPSLEKQIEELKAAQPTDDWEAKYKQAEDEKAKLNEEFEAFKTKVANDASLREKAELYKALLRECGIEDKRLDAILKVTDLDTVKVSEGAIEDAEVVKEAIAKEWDAFIPQKDKSGASVPEPPSIGGSSSGADPDTVKRLQERHDRLYGKNENNE